MTYFILYTQHMCIHILHEFRTFLLILCHQIQLGGQLATNQLLGNVATEIMEKNWR